MSTSAVAARQALDRERAAEAQRSASASSKLQGILSSALARFGVEVEAPAPLPDRAAQRQRDAVTVADGRVNRAELAAALNAGHDPRVQVHIERSRQHVADEEQLERGRAALRLAPHRRGERPVSKADTPRTKIHREARIMMQTIVNSRGAYVIQSYLHKLRPIFSGQPLAALRAAALGPIAGTAFCRWTYADDCARRRIAIGLMFLCCGRWTNQRTAFGSRSTRRGLVIAGLCVDTILRWATPVGRLPYDRHVFGAGSSAASVDRGWRGDMALFERYGFAVRKRLPSWRLNAWEIGPTGQGMNRYWVGSVVSNTDPKREQRNRRMTPLGAALGGAMLDPAAHAVGWEWATEVPSYPPRAPDKPT
jgi:hypothetical protein